MSLPGAPSPSEELGPGDQAPGFTLMSWVVPTTIVAHPIEEPEERERDRVDHRQSRGDGRPARRREGVWWGTPADLRGAARVEAGGGAPPTGSGSRNLNVVGIL